MTSLLVKFGNIQSGKIWIQSDFYCQIFKSSISQKIEISQFLSTINCLYTELHSNNASDMNSHQHQHHSVQ